MATNGIPKTQQVQNKSILKPADGNEHGTQAANNQATATVNVPSTARKGHTHHESGGIIMHCDDSDCEDASNHFEVNTPPEFVPDSAASSSGFDRHQADILRSMHPMRKEIVGASDDVCIDTEQSSVQGVNNGQIQRSPWLANNGNFLEQTKPLKVDLLLPQPNICIENNILQLEEADYTPISIGWGFSLLGFFIERFPGKDAVLNLTKRWKFPARVSFHPKGWIIFRFETEAHSQAVLNGGPYHVFGIPLVLCLMPSEFRFDSSPAFNFKVWASLPNLPLELWNASAISKIASTVGTPLEVDHQTISKNYVAGPRVLILIDGAKEPPNSIMLKLHNGNTFEQQILLDYYPYFCTRCRRAGHLASTCRVPERTNPGTRMPPRNHHDLNTENGGWQVVKNRKQRPGRSRSRMPANRPSSRVPSRAPPRNNSRPPKQQWQPINQAQHTAATPRNEDNQGQKITNTHIYFDSPTSEQNGIDLSNKFQAFDELEQVEEAATVHQHTLNRPQPGTTSLPKNQPMQRDLPINKISLPATPKQYLNCAEACDPAAARIPPPTDADPNQNNKNKGMLNAKTGAVPVHEQHTTRADGADPKAATNNATAPSTARYRPPPARHENTILQRVHSTDTFSTDYIRAGNGANYSAANNNNQNTSEAEHQSATPLAAPENNNEQVPPTYATALTSPNHIVDAGTKQNLGKQRIEEKLLDPRLAIKNKKKQAHLSSTGGRVLANNNPSKKRK